MIFFFSFRFARQSKNKNLLVRSINRVKARTHWDRTKTKGRDDRWPGWRHKGQEMVDTILCLSAAIRDMEYTYTHKQKKGREYSISYRCAFCNNSRNGSARKRVRAWHFFFTRRILFIQKFLHERREKPSIRNDTANGTQLHTLPLSSILDPGRLEYIQNSCASSTRGKRLTRENSTRRK